MKKLLILPLVLSAGVLMSGCGNLKQEQDKEVTVQNNASKQLDKVIKEKAEMAAGTAEAGAISAEGMVDGMTEKIMPETQGTEMPEKPAAEPEKTPMEL